MRIFSSCKHIKAHVKSAEALAHNRLTRREAIDERGSSLIVRRCWPETPLRETLYLASGEHQNHLRRERLATDGI